MLNDLYHSLDPVAFSAGPITIYWYGIAYIVGAALTGVVMYRTQKRWGFHISMDDLWTVVTCVVFGLLIGARLFYLVFYGRGLEYYLSNPLEIIAVNHGGMSFHGGLVGGIAGGAIACRMLGLSFWTLADLAVIGAPLALCLGRCANFVNGELWGKPTDLPWGVVFETGATSRAIRPSSTSLSRRHRALCNSSGAQPPQEPTSSGLFPGRVRDGLRNRPLFGGVCPGAGCTAGIYLGRRHHHGADSLAAAHRCGNRPACMVAARATSPARLP